MVFPLVALIRPRRGPQTKPAHLTLEDSILCSFDRLSDHLYIPFEPEKCAFFLQITPYPLRLWIGEFFRGSLARRSGSVARYPLLASRAIFASSSSPNHSSSPAAAFAKELRFAERAGHPEGKRDPPSVVFHLEVWSLESEETVRSNSTTCREQEAWPWKLRASYNAMF